MRKKSLAGIFLMTSATLCLEIVLIRYFSISQHYHFAFLVVSIAFLGYGASGSFLSLVAREKHPSRTGWMSGSALGFSLSVLVCFILTNLIPFDLMNISWDVRQLFLVFVYYILLSIPFFFAGLVISSAIASFPHSVSKIYLFDLTGAGFGTILSLFVFLPKGDRGTILIISCLALLASYFLDQELHPRGLLLRLAIFLLIAGLFILAPSWLSFRISPYKELPVALKYPRASHLLTRWNAISRIDILESPAIRHAPGMSLQYTQRLPEQLGLTIDGASLTAIPHTTPLDDPSWQFLSYLPSSFPYSILSHPTVLILDPRGSLDIMSARIQGASHTRVAEKNPLIEKILREDIPGIAEEFFDPKTVSFQVSTVRDVLRQEGPSYDLIVFPLTDVFGASGTGISGFDETYSLTREAFREVLARLKPNGIASMSFFILPPPRAGIRAASTWIEVLESMEKDPGAHLMVIRSWGTISLFIKKTPVSHQDIQALKAFSRERLFDLVFYPGIKRKETNTFNKHPEPIYHDLISRLLEKERRESLYDEYLFQIEPVNDERPYFNNFFKMNKIKRIYTALGKKWLPLLQGEPIILLLLLQAAAAAFLLILFPIFFIQKRKPLRKGIYVHTAFYFGLIGSAYMFVEIVFIQKFILFLGHPVYSSAIIIFSLLGASGLGSLVSRRIPLHKLERMKKTMLCLCTGMIVLTMVFLPLLFKACAGFSLLMKVILTVTVILPAGFVMGFPFPTGIRILARGETHLIPWAWATNAFSSVIHAILALLIAFHGGYTLVLGLAAAGYLLSLPFLDLSRHRNEPDS